MTQSSEGSRERFLAAAERLFIEHGYRGTTIRAVCAEAGTSLAILNRNWPHKEALFTEMLQQHFEPLHRLQEEGFAALDGAGEAPSLAAVIKAFYRPAFRQISKDAELRSSVYSRALIDPSREIKKIVAGLIKDTRTRLAGLVQQALPGLKPEEAFLVMNMVLGGYVYPQAFGHQLAVSMALDDREFDWPAAADRMAETIAAGLAAQFGTTPSTR